MRKNNHNKQTSCNFYYMYGTHTVMSALSNPNRKKTHVLCTKEAFSNNSKILSSNSYEIVDNKTLDKILGHTYPHQGIIAKVQTIFSNDINDIDLNNPNCKIAILDQVTDPQNVGAIIRSAAAFGIDSILLTNDNSPNETASLAKAAAGTLEIIKIIKIVNIRNALDFLKNNGFWVIGLDVNGNENLTNNLFQKKIAIILGSEDKGLRRLTQESCDFLIKIPIKNTVESLNVSNTASIIFYLMAQ